MKRGWEVELEDRTVINENQLDWAKIPKNRIIRLTLRYDGREWNLENGGPYLQKKRGSMIPFIPESFQVESRSIGYYDGNSKVWYTVKEATGKMRVEVEDT